MGAACCPGVGTGADTCNAGLACGGNGTCGACGGVGQACCPDPTGAINGICGTGFVCANQGGGGGGGGGRACIACGGRTQPCCGTGAVATRTCGAGLTCGTNAFCN
jgi:hypothetical protein